MNDYGKSHRAALIAGNESPKLSHAAKVQIAINRLGPRYVLAGGKPDWSRPTVLPEWISRQDGAASRVAGL